MPKGVKDIFKRAGNKILKGEFHDITKTPCPAWMHCDLTLLNLMSYDLIFCRKYLLPAVQVNDPLERMKLIIAFFVAP